MARVSQEYRNNHPMCRRFAVTHDDARQRGLCSYYGDSYPDGSINWTGPQEREGGAFYCDRHWTQIQAERATR